MNTLESKIKELQTLLNLDLSYVPMAVKSLSTSGWSDDEIVTIIDHFMSGGMLSEIIAPAENAKTRNAIIVSEDALRSFDHFFWSKVTKVPGLQDKLLSIWGQTK